MADEVVPALHGPHAGVLAICSGDEYSSASSAVLCTYTGGCCA